MIRELFSRWFQKKESAVTKSILVGGNGYGWSQQDLEKIAKEAYEGNVIAYACISGISDAVAGINWFLEAPDGEEIPNQEQHPFYLLWQRPNPTMSTSTFLRQVTTYYFAEGNSYTEKTRGKLELWPLRPDRVKINYKQVNGKFVLSYEYRLGSAEPTTFPSEDVLHLKVFSPTDDFYGKSPLLAAASAIDTDNEAVKWNYSLVKQGGRPSGVFKVENALQDDQYIRLKEQIQENWSGRNSIAPKILENGIEWTPTGLSPHDMDFIQGLRVLARRICTATNYPPELIGDSENKTYSNYMEARRVLYEDVVCPFLDYLRDEFNHWLAPLWDNTARLQYDKDDIEALQENRAQMFDRIAAADWLSINEQREATGFPRIPGDEYDKPRAVTSQAPLMPNFGIPPPEEEEDTEEAEEKPPKEIEEKPKSVRFWGLKTVDEKQVAYRQIEKERHVFSKQFARELKIFFRQEKNLIKQTIHKENDNISAALESVGALINGRKANLSVIFRKWYLAIGRWFFNRIRNGIKGDSPSDSKAIADWLRDMRMHFSAKIARQVRYITETTQLQIANIMRDGIDANDSTADIVDRLMAYYEDVYVKNRADTIAGTETVSVSNYGAMMGAKATEQPVMKYWISQRDDIVRKTHEDANDESELKGTPMDEPFHVGNSLMQYPGDESLDAEPEEIINCRCFLSFEAM